MDIVLLLKLYPIRRVLLGVLTPVDRLNLLCAVNDLQQSYRDDGNRNGFPSDLCSDLFVPLLHDNEEKPISSVAELKRVYNFIGTHNCINYMIMTAIYEIVLFRNLLCEESKVPGKQYPWMQQNQHVTDRYVQRRNTFRNFLLFIRRQLRLRIYDVDDQQDGLPAADQKNNSDGEVVSSDNDDDDHDADDADEVMMVQAGLGNNSNNKNAEHRIRFELTRKQLSMQFDLTFRDNSHQNSFRTDWEHDALQLAKDIFLDERNETQHFFLTQRGVFLDVVDSVFCSSSTVFEHCPFLMQPFTSPSITAAAINSVVLSSENTACTARLLDHTIDAFIEAYRKFDTRRSASGFVAQTCLEIEEHLIGLKHHKCSMNSNPSRIMHHALITVYGSKVVQPYDSRLTADIESYLRHRIELGSWSASSSPVPPLRVRIELNSICVYLACDNHHGLKKILSIYLVYLPRVGSRSQPPTSTKLYASPTTNLLVDNDLITIASVRFKYIPRVEVLPSVKRKRSAAAAAEAATASTTSTSTTDTTATAAATAVANDNGWLKFASFYYDYHAVQRSVFAKFLQVFLLELRRRNGGRPFYNYFHIQQIQTAELLTPISNDFTVSSYHSSSMLLHSKDLFRPSDQLEHQCFVQDDDDDDDDDDEDAKETATAELAGRKKQHGRAAASYNEHGDENGYDCAATTAARREKKRYRGTTTRGASASSAADPASDTTGSAATFCIRVKPTMLNLINSKLVGEPRYRIY